MGFDDAVNPEVEIGNDITPHLSGLGPFGILPIILPHKNKARFVMLTGQTCKKDIYSYYPELAVAEQDAAASSKEQKLQSPKVLVSNSNCKSLQLDRAQQQRLLTSISSNSSTTAEHEQQMQQIIAALCPTNPITNEDDNSPQSPITSSKLLSHSENIPIYDVIETNDTSVVGGILAFLGIGPAAFGIGLLGNYKNSVRSTRKVIGKEMAYYIPELDPPKTYQEIANWLDLYTRISWQQLRGFKVIAGAYAIAHAGGDFSAEGIWTHTVTKEKKKLCPSHSESEVITVSLAFEKQYRLKLTAGVVPLISANKDLLHAAKSKTLTFRFQDIQNNQTLQKLLEKMLDKQNTLDESNRVIIEAMALAQEYKEKSSDNGEAPLSFVCQINRDEKESKDKFRLRLPLIANKEVSLKKRNRTESHCVHLGDKTLQSQVDISEKIKRKEFQYPLDSALTAKEKRVYAERLGVDKNKKIKWPIDYRNNLYEELTQVRDSSQIDMSSPFQISHYRLIWKAADNYITKEKFNQILNKIGAKTGLLPILFRDKDIHDFLGPIQHKDNPRESMYLLMEIHLTDSEWDQLCQNILSNEPDSYFEELTLKLFDNYAKHPNKDYLNLNKDYDSFEEYYKKKRQVIRNEAITVVSKAKKAHEKLIKNKEESCFGFFCHELSSSEKLNLKRKVLDSIKVNPFVFLTALIHINPKCYIKLSGTSSSLERVLETSLARDIMNNMANIPTSYMLPSCVC